MFNIQSICETIAEKVALELKLEKEQRAVIHYGLFAIVQTVICIILSIVFGVLFGVLIPTLIMAVSAVILRKYSGGAHSQTPEYCAAVSTIVSVGGALIATHIQWDITNMSIVIALIFTVSFILVYRLAPIDSKEKPIRRIEKRKMLKKKSIFVLATYFIISVAGLRVYHYDNDKKWLLYISCICIGTIWQVFTLTRLGHRLIAKIDGFLNKLFAK